VIAVPGETIPHKIRKGQVSEYDGWVLPTPLFNELTPCFKKMLEEGEPETPPREMPTRAIERPTRPLPPYRRFPGTPPRPADSGDHIAQGE
jgi:hypothetical protein